MSASRALLASAVLACLSASALADAPWIFCVGSACGGGGPREYAYLVDAVSYPMMEFRVGTSDLFPGRYTDVILPEGWKFAIDDEHWMYHACGLHAPHGEISGGPCWSLTPGSAVWWTDDPQYAVEYFTFGFNHPWKSEDVGWTLTTRREGDPPEWYVFTEFWDAPVGTGLGPVHGPYVPACPADITDDGVVDVLDLLLVLAQWGTSGSADITGDGVVDVLDLLEVLGAWGPCPPADFVGTELAGNPLPDYPHFQYVRAFGKAAQLRMAHS